MKLNFAGYVSFLWFKYRTIDLFFECFDNVMKHQNEILAQMCSDSNFRAYRV